MLRGSGRGRHGARRSDGGGGRLRRDDAGLSGELVRILGFVALLIFLTWRPRPELEPPRHRPPGPFGPRRRRDRGRLIKVNEELTLCTNTEPILFEAHQREACVRLPLNFRVRKESVGRWWGGGWSWESRGGWKKRAEKEVERRESGEKKETEAKADGTPKERQGGQVVERLAQHQGRFSPAPPNIGTSRQGSH